MIKKISKTVLTSALVFLLSTGNVLAQNWIAPAGSPPGNNVPAPVNIGGQTQAKSGKFTVNNTFTVNGDTIFGLDDDAGLFTNFLQSYFFNNTNFGDATPYNNFANEIPVDVSVYGKLKYQTADNNGNPQPLNPGYVLQLNDEDYAEWVDPATLGGGAALAPGNTLGQFYAWDGDSWELTTHFFANEWGDPPAFEVKNGGTLFVGDNSYVFVRPTAQVRLMNGNPGMGKILADSGTGQGVLAWKTAQELGIGDAALPPGQTNGEVLRWDAETQLWERTNMLLVGAGLGETSISTNPISTKNIDLVTNNDATAGIFLRSPKIKIMPSGEVFDAGYVLSSAGEDGTVTWVDPLSLLPDGTNIGDILIWNGTTWITGPNTGDGGDGQATLPPGSLGQTMVYGTGGWQATSKIQHIGGNDMANATDFHSASLNFGEQNPSDGPGDNQIATFFSNVVRFKGFNGSLNPKAGRLAFSTDDDGSFSWAKGLRYTTQGQGNQTQRTLSLTSGNGEGSAIQVFNNEGLTFLQDDVDITGVTTIHNSDLYLDGTDQNEVRLMGGVGLYIDTLPSASGNELKNVCWDQQTNKIVQCPQTIIDTEPNNPGETTITYSVDDNDESIHFTTSTTLQMKWCGAGGGGGGGGIGNEAQVGAQIVYGGGGGGGGQAGECKTATQTFNPGDILTWNAGMGGNGGNGACDDDNSNVVNCPGGQIDYPAQDGEDGVGTSLYLNGNVNAIVGNGFSPGGQGGDKGCSFFENGVYPNTGCSNTLGGELGNNAPVGPGTGPWGGYGGTGYLGEWWNHGNAGYGFTDWSYASAGQGGDGGDGESPVGLIDSTSNQTSAGGHGGTSQDGGGTNNPNVYGVSGYGGDYSYGGGGGGGSNAQVRIFGNQSGQAQSYPYTRGGNGGNGGNGYITLTGPSNVLNNVPGVGGDDIIYSNSVTNIPIDLWNIPRDAEEIFIELWGAGGGGGSVNYSQNQNGNVSGGGGASGQYMRIKINTAEVGTPNYSNGYSSFQFNCLGYNGTSVLHGCLRLSVGAGGSLGIANSSQAGAGAKTGVMWSNGSTDLPASSFNTCMNGSNNSGDYCYVVSGGGAGGTGTAGTLGTGGTANSTFTDMSIGSTVIVQQTIPSDAGYDGGLNGGGTGGGGTIFGYANKGGNGSFVQVQGGFVTPTPGTNGSVGRVRIFWQ